MAAAEESLTVEEVAERVKVSVFTVKRWLNRKELRGYRLSGPTSEWRVRASALQEFIEAREAAAQRE